MNAILDSHALLWWFSGSPHLSAKARRAIAAADTLAISAITCWEVALLVGKGRVRLDRDVHTWFRDLFSETSVEPIPVSVHGAVAAGILAGEGSLPDPADAVIYATAQEHSLQLVTKDARLIDLARARGDVRTIW